MDILMVIVALTFFVALLIAGLKVTQFGIRRTAQGIRQAERPMGPIVALVVLFLAIGIALAFVPWGSVLAEYEQFILRFIKKGG